MCLIDVFNDVIKIEQTNKESMTILRYLRSLRVLGRSIWSGRKRVLKDMLKVVG